MQNWKCQPNVEEIFRATCVVGYTYVDCLLRCLNQKHVSWKKWLRKISCKAILFSAGQCVCGAISPIILHIQMWVCSHYTHNASYSPFYTIIHPQVYSRLYIQGYIPINTLSQWDNDSTWLHLPQRPATQRHCSGFSATGNMTLSVTMPFADKTITFLFIRYSYMCV